MIGEKSSPASTSDERLGKGQTILWWGRSDLEYARNRTLRRCLIDAGFRLLDFRPHISAFGDLEAARFVRSPVDLVWVPCFRQRDVAAARRWCSRHNVPLLFDPLISAYDKQVFEREKFSRSGFRAKRLLAWERELFACADMILADTEAHARFFHQMHAVPENDIRVVPLCADEELFRPLEPSSERTGPLQVLFFGSFIPLQGPQVIVDAANLYRGPPVRWCLVGDGPLRASCQHRVKTGTEIQFEDWIPYQALPARIAEADIVLGIFGNTPKAERVVPNKLCQALAIGRPVVTRASPAISERLGRLEDTGLFVIPPTDPVMLANTIARLAQTPSALEELGKRANETYFRYFSSNRVSDALISAVGDLVNCVPAN